MPFNEFHRFKTELPGTRGDWDFISFFFNWFRFSWPDGSFFFKRIIIRSVFVDFTMWTSTLNDPSFFLLPAFHEVSQGDGTVCNCVFFLLLFFLWWWSGFGAPELQRRKPADDGGGGAAKKVVNWFTMSPMQPRGHVSWSRSVQFRTLREPPSASFRPRLSFTSTSLWLEKKKTSQHNSADDVLWISLMIHQLDSSFGSFDSSFSSFSSSPRVAFPNRAVRSRNQDYVPRKDLLLFFFNWNMKTKRNVPSCFWAFPFWFGVFLRIGFFDRPKEIENAPRVRDRVVKQEWEINGNAKSFFFLVFFFLLGKRFH